MSQNTDIKRYESLFNKTKKSDSEKKELYKLEAELFDEGHFTGVNYHGSSSIKKEGSDRITNPFML